MRIRRMVERKIPYLPFHIINVNIKKIFSHKCCLQFRLWTCDRYPERGLLLHMQNLWVIKLKKNSKFLAVLPCSTWKSISSPLNHSIFLEKEKRKRINLSPSSHCGGPPLPEVAVVGRYLRQRRLRCWRLPQTSPLPNTRTDCLPQLMEAWDLYRVPNGFYVFEFQISKLLIFTKKF